MTPQMLDHSTLYLDIHAAERPFVYRLAFRLTRCRWFAEEICQEVFIRVWLHRDKLPFLKDVRAWLNTITRRMTADFLVKRANEYRFFTSRFRATAIASLEDASLARRCLALLAEAQSRLTPRQKDVFRLSYIDGLSRPEIARVLSIAEPTVLFFMKTSNRAVRRFITEWLEAA